MLPDFGQTGDEPGGVVGHGQVGVSDDHLQLGGPVSVGAAGRGDDVPVADQGAPAALTNRDIAFQKGNLGGGKILASSFFQKFSKSNLQLICLKKLIRK